MTPSPSLTRHALQVRIVWAERLRSDPGGAGLEGDPMFTMHRAQYRRHACSRFGAGVARQRRTARSEHLLAYTPWHPRLCTEGTRRRHGSRLPTHCEGQPRYSRDCRRRCASPGHTSPGHSPRPPPRC